MKRVFHVVVVAVLAAEALVLGQGQDVMKILADVRAALGGDKLAAVKTLSIEGKTTRVSGEQSQQSPVEYAIELPGRYVRNEQLSMMGMTIGRVSGFSGNDLIEKTDTPPAMSSNGGRVVTRMSGGPVMMGGAAPTPEQQAEQRRVAVLAMKQEFTRLALGMFATSFDAYPVKFAGGGQAEAPDGKADVIIVTGADGFSAKLYIDAASHLPLMLSWMDKEPLRLAPMVIPGGGGQMITSSGGGTMTMSSGGSGSGGGATSQTFTRQVGGSGGGTVSTSGTPLTPEQVEKMRADNEARRKEAEAARRTVEYRMFYADYKDVNGVKLPTRIQRMIDGQPVEELSVEKYKVNPKFDDKKFEVVK